MKPVEWNDVQGLILSGYPKLPKAAYVLWRLRPGEPQRAKRWLGQLAARLKVATPLGVEPTDRAVNVALAASALRKLGIERSAFSAEYLDGMASAPPPSSKLTVSRRSSQLGDIDNNDPEHWIWGGRTRNAEVDGVLLLYAPCDSRLEDLINSERRFMEGAAEVLECPETRLPLILKAYLKCDSKEHFGFRDGISQPFIKGSPPTKKAMHAHFDVIKPGEFIIGYEGERDPALAGPSGSGASAGGRDSGMDLQRNGTYLVFRHLEQKVAEFDKFLTETAKTVRGSPNADAREWVAARLIGRWRSGRPLIDPPFAQKDTPAATAPRNDFLYHFEDRFGLTCPIGAHIRRANPRDTLSTDPDTALRLSKMHRIIRRGRMYGPQVAHNGADRNAGGEESRGMYFICLNADIAGQFELIQHSWLNNTHFGGLYDERDPLVNRDESGGVLTIQQRPSNLRLEGLSQFISVRGGAYFFMPGIAALGEMAR